MIFKGMNVYVMPVYPKIAVRNDFKWISEKCRKSMNCYLASRFGYHEVDDKVYIDKNRNAIYAPMHIFEQMKREIPEL